MARIFRTVLAIGVPLFLVVSVHAAPLTFRATLTGEQEVPAVDEPTRGTATFRFDPGLREMRYDVRVATGVGVTQAHLHCAAAGVNGPVVVFLAWVYYSAQIVFFGAEVIRAGLPQGGG